MAGKPQPNAKSRKPEYGSWRAMCERCRRKGASNFRRYGGRGIEVCQEWIGKDGFHRFLSHIGPKPTPDHTVGRINNDEGYKPGNVRWETRQQQSANRTGFCVYVTFDGKTQTLAEWSRELGIHYETLRSRYKRKIPVEKLLEAGRSRKNPQKVRT